MAQRADPCADLLLGMLALREGWIDRDQLIAAFEGWTSAQDLSMAEVLVAQGSLDESGRGRLEALLARRHEIPVGPRELGPAGGLGDGSTDDRPTGIAASEVSETIAHVGPVAGQDDPRSDGVSTPLGGRRYRILRPHARGGLGEVFLALDSELKREVALKVLPAELADNAVSRSRFQLEAELTGRLEHPGVVPVYGLGCDDGGRPYYAMRFIEGQTLKEAIDGFHSATGNALEPRERELAFRRLLRCVIDASNAVAYAHSRGVVHRDLKPENIMIGRFGETLVVDWGLAKPLSRTEGLGKQWDSAHDVSGGVALTLQGAVVGTPRYMSPEQVAGNLDQIGPATDVYGLGAILYCVLVGHAPFTAGDLPDLLGRVRSGIFPSPRRLRPSIDPALEAICLKAMAAQRHDRYPTPLDLAGAIEAWLADVRYRGEQAIAVDQMKRSMARLCFERALNLFGRERPPEGRLWLARALESIPAGSPDLDRLVRANLAVWHAGTKLLTRSLPHGGDVRAVAFAAGGRLLATASADGAARLWDLATGSPLSTDLAHEGPVNAVAFSPDGRMVVTGGEDGTVRRWDAVSSETIGRPIEHGSPIQALHFSPDGSMVAALGARESRCLWHAATWEPILGSAERGLRILALAFSPDPDLFATACDDGRVRLWSTTARESIGEPLRHESAVLALAFSPDGRSLLTGCRDGKARLWDVGRRVSDVELFPGSAVTAVRFSPPGRSIATACDEGTARLWSIPTGAPLGEALDHRGRVTCLEFDPAGTLLATGGRDGSVRLWDAVLGLPIGPPLEHRGAVHALAFSSDGQRLATGSSDGKARFWAVPTPIEGDAERIACWARVTTGLDFDDGDAIRPLEPLRRWELRHRLQQLGGEPARRH